LSNSFSYCRYAESLVIGNNVKTIGEMAFTYCTRLNSLSIGESVETIDDGAFYGCCTLKDVVIPDNVKTIGRGAFEDSEQLVSLTIGKSVETIGDGAFYACRVLTDVYVHATIPTEITESTFDKKVYKNAILHIPSGCIQNYINTQYWNSFAHIVDDVESSGILLPSTVEKPQSIYDVNGIRLSHFKHGINILKYKNGKTKKTYVH
jgi:hypothetical protein